MSKNLCRIRDSSSLTVGDLTNKGIVEVIYSKHDVRIDCMYYDLSKHKVYKQAK